MIFRVVRQDQKGRSITFRGPRDATATKYRSLWRNLTKNLSLLHLRMAEQNNSVQQAHYRARLRPPAEKRSTHYRVESSQLLRRSGYMG